MCLPTSLPLTPAPAGCPVDVGGKRCPRSVSGGLPPPAQCMTGAREEIPSPALGLSLPKGLLCLQSPAGPEPALRPLLHLLWPVQIPVMLKFQPIFSPKQAQPVTLGTARWRKTVASCGGGRGWGWTEAIPSTGTQSQDRLLGPHFQSKFSSAVWGFRLLPKRHAGPEGSHQPQTLPHSGRRSCLGLIFIFLNYESMITHVQEIWKYRTRFHILQLFF